MIKAKATKNMFEEYEKQIELFKKQEVVIGLPKGGEGVGKVKKNGETLLSIAITHEFGSPQRGIPQRSFLRVPMQKNKNKIIKRIQTEFSKVANSSQTANIALEKLGILGQGISQKSFTSNDWQENSDITKELKGSSRPLIDTGQLRQSITYDVRKKQ